MGCLLEPTPDNGGIVRAGLLMRKKKNYIFTNKKNSNRAIMAVILGVISLVSLGTVVFLSGLDGGNARMGYGFTGLLASAFSLTGLILGVVTIQNKDYYRMFPVLGILLNLLALAVVGLILYAGTNL